MWTTNGWNQWTMSGNLSPAQEAKQQARAKKAKAKVLFCFWWEGARRDTLKPLLDNSCHFQYWRKLMKSEYSLYISSLSICAVLNTMIIRSVYIYICVCAYNSRSRCGAPPHRWRNRLKSPLWARPECVNSLWNYSRATANTVVKSKLSIGDFDWWPLALEPQSIPKQQVTVRHCGRPSYACTGKAFRRFCGTAICKWGW